MYWADEDVKNEAIRIQQMIKKGKEFHGHGIPNPSGDGKKRGS